MAATTWNPSDAGSGITFSNGNRTAAYANNLQGVRATNGRSAGRLCYQITYDSNGGTSAIDVGIALASAPLSPGFDSDCWIYNSNNGHKFQNAVDAAYGASWNTGDVITIDVDIDNLQLTFYKNGISQGLAFTLPSGQTWFPMCGVGGANPNQITAVFGSTMSFIPSGSAPWDGFTATLAATEGAEISTFTGGPASVGALAATEGVETANFVGGAISTGTLAATEGAETAAFAGWVASAGTMASTEGAETSSVSGAPQPYGQVNDTLALADTVTMDVINVIHERLGLSSTPSSSLRAVFSIVERATFSTALSITRNLLINESVSFTDAFTAKRDLVTLLVDSLVLGDAVSSRLDAVSLVAVAMAMNGSPTAAFAMNITEALHLDNTLLAQWVAYATAIESVVFASTATMTRKAVLVVTSPLVLTDTPSAQASLIALVTDSLAFDAVLIVDGIEFDVWAVNTANGAPSQYTNFSFDSMCRLGERYYGAGDDGLFLLDGEDDDGDAIQESILTGELDFGSPNLKRVDMIHIGATSAGDVVLKVTTTYKNTQGVSVKREDWYRAVKADGTSTEQRVKLGKGLKSQYWQFEILNTQGKDLDLDRINLRVLELSRRV